MLERDNNDHNQKDHKNPKSDLQCLRDSERAQDVREYLIEQDKLLLALLNVVIQFIQRKIHEKIHQILSLKICEFSTFLDLSHTTPQNFSDGYEVQDRVGPGGGGGGLRFFLHLRGGG